MTEAMPPKLAQVALDVQFLYQPLQIILYNFGGLVQLFEDLQQRRQLTQFVTQALPIIARICTDICGNTYHDPRLTNAGRALVQDMETQLGLARGDGVSGIAEWFLGSPPISLLLESARGIPGARAVIGIFRQGNGPHFKMNLRAGLPAFQVSSTLLHLVGPLCRSNGRPERIFVHNPNPGRDKGKGKGKGNQVKGQGRGKGGRGKGKQNPSPNGRERSPRGLHATRHPLVYHPANVPLQANYPAPEEGQVGQQQAGPPAPGQQPPFPPRPTTPPPGVRRAAHRHQSKQALTRPRTNTRNSRSCCF